MIVTTSLGEFDYKDGVAKYLVASKKRAADLSCAVGVGTFFFIVTTGFLVPTFSLDFMLKMEVSSYLGRHFP